MRKMLVYILSVALAVTAISCSKFLDFRPEATMPSTGTDYSKPENIFSSVSAAYASLRGGHSFNYVCLFEITSDDADKGSTDADSPEAKEMDKFSYTPSNSLINSVWVEFYNMGSAANFAIEEMPKFEAAMNTEANRLYTRQCAGEARIIRAYAYFNLLRCFGRVPIIDRPMTSDELASVRQSSVDDVYKFICDDLDYAIENVPASYDASWSGRFTKYTAMALKAKAALYHGDWEECAKQCDAVMASGRFSLLPSFREVFSVDGENSRESLMEVQSSTLGQSTGAAPYIEYAYVQGPRNNTPSNMQGWGFNVPSDALISFLTGRGETARMAATLLYRGTTTPEGDYISEKCTNPVYNGKVYTPSSYNKWSYNGYGFDHNVRLLRYSDVLLMFAEARLNGAVSGTESGRTADDALNEVRSRVGLPAVSATLESVYDERRAEFALEENRFFDLVRTGRAAAVLGPLGFKTGKNEVFPVPSAQIQLNNNLEHTAGYSY